MPAITAPIQLSDHVYIVHAEFPHVDSGNVYLITGSHPTLIDCGSPRTVPQLVKNIAQVGLEVHDIDQVIATHGDYDHVQGFHGLREMNQDLRLLIHRAEITIVQGENAYSTASYLYDQPFVRLDPAYCAILDDGDVVPAHGSGLKVVHTPGHTEGSICLLGEIDSVKMLFAGDTFGGAMRSLDGADLHVWANAARTWMQSLRRLSALDFDIVLNGHELAAELPIRRPKFDRLVKHFGKMLDPWFSYEAPEPTGPMPTTSP
ncbi:MAG: MBL fold metallo-hydrolase [Chloroflexota bacterium]|nr:MBL fold metallo-hydrolase [Chloroflexota bacterium]